MENDLIEARSPSPATTILSTAPSTAPSLADLPSQHFSTVNEVFKAVDKASQDDYDVFIVTGISPQQFVELGESRDRLGRKLRFFHLAQESLVIITIPARKHEKAHRHLYTDIEHEIRQMGLRMDFQEVASTRLRSNHPDGSSREGDSSGGPYPERTADDAWPTLVIESGVSQSLPDLRSTIRWWFAASDHAVKIVLIVKVNRAQQQIILEKWTEGNNAKPRLGATTTRLLHALYPIQRQVITINVAEEVATTAQNDPVRRHPASYTVSRGELRLEFQLLFLRPPNENVGEGDIIITTLMLQYLAAKVWCI